MTNYNGQEDLDPLINILLANNNIESTGNPELDLIALEEKGMLVIQQAAGSLALRETELQHA